MFKSDKILFSVFPPKTKRLLSMYHKKKIIVLFKATRSLHQVSNTRFVDSKYSYTKIT